MSTKLRWQSLDLIARLMYPIMWRHTVTWDPKSKQLVYKMSRRQLVIYGVLEFYLLVIAGSLCPIFVLIRYILVPGMEPMPLESIIFLVGFGASCVFDSTVSLVDIKVKDDVCPAFNCLAEMERQFEREMRTGGFTPAVDIVGYLLNGFVLTVYFVGYLMPLFVYRNMDPLFYIITDVIPIGVFGQILHAFFFPVRLFTLTYSYFAAVRVTKTLFAVFIIGLKILLRCVDILVYSVQEQPQRNDPLMEILRRRKLFMKLQLVVRILDMIVAPSATGIMSLGLILSVAYNFATLRMYTIIPMPTYLYFPLVAVLVPLMAHLELPEGIRMYEGTSGVLQGWKGRLDSVAALRKRAQLSRMLKGTQPCKFHSGLVGFNFFLLKNSTKSTYYYTMVDFTINALMSIPLSAVQDAF